MKDELAFTEGLLESSNKPQTIQSEPNGVFSCQQLTSEPERRRLELLYQRQFAQPDYDR